MKKKTTGNIFINESFFQDVEWRSAGCSSFCIQGIVKPFQGIGHESDRWHYGCHQYMSEKRKWGKVLLIINLRMSAVCILFSFEQ